jgi:hypothetical protein
MRKSLGVKPSRSRRTGILDIGRSEGVLATGPGDTCLRRVPRGFSGVEFLTRGIASIAGLRTTWFKDPRGVLFILMEKRDPAKPYFAQY